MMLVQLLIPLTDNEGAPFPASVFATLRDELSSAFGGLTAYTRSPAVGLWRTDDDAAPQRDDIIVYEVLVDDLDRAWWAAYRQELERRFAQDELMIRAHSVDRL
jgi:hypothetical protein